MSTTPVSAPPRAAQPRWRALVPPLWGLALAALMLGPALGPGFVLGYDMVLTPRQDLLPGSLGLGGGLPRAVPQDAVVALVELILTGEVVQKAVLLAIPVLAVTGMVRLLRGQPLLVGLVAGTLAAWNPFVAERLLIGHWALLLAYALTPWALALAVDVRRGVDRAGPRLLLILAACSLTPSGAILAAGLAIPPAIARGSALSRRGQALVVAAAVTLSLPWIVPALLHPSVTNADPLGASVFALRSEGPWGAVVTALGLGGIWNAEVVLPSRGWWLAPVGAAVLLLLAGVGWSRLVTHLGRTTTWWWAGVAVVGLVAALASALAPDAWSTLVTSVPGLGLARDAHKLLAPLALLLAAAGAMGLGRLAGRVADPASRRTLLAAGLLVPLAFLPDLALGAAGRLSPVTYPEDWSRVRATLLADPRPGDVAVVPWSAFRRYAWNDNRTSLDPAPRWLPRATVVDDALLVARDGEIIVVAGDDPRAATIRELLESADTAEELGAGLASLGIRWVLEQPGQPPGVPETVRGLPIVLPGTDLILREVPGEIAEAPGPGPAVVAAVVLVDLAALGLVAILIGLSIRRRPDVSGPGLVR